MTEPAAPETVAGSSPDDRGSSGSSAGVWVIVPTFNEADNLGPIAAAILDALPAATVLVVDDNSPGRHGPDGR